MSTQLSYREFNKTCLELCRQPEVVRHGADYYEGQSIRLYDTYRICLKYVKPSQSVISAGAGGATIEKLLINQLNIDVTSVDHAEAHEQHEKNYKVHKIKSVSMNLCQPLDIQGQFDCAFSFEVLEHLFLPPADHIAWLTRCLKPGGTLIITTPNLGRIGNCVKLFRGKPISESAERTFLPADFENEGIHRREYQQSEIIDALHSCGLGHTETIFTDYCEKEKISHSYASQFIRQFLPRFSSVMMIVAHKSA